MKKLILSLATSCITIFGYSQNLKVLILHADQSYVTDVKNKLENTPIISEVDVFNVGLTTPSVDYLQEYNSVLVYRNNNFADVVSLGDVLAEYIEQGGGLVNAVFDNQDNGPASNTVIAGNFVNYKLVSSEFDAYGGPVSLGTINNPAHPIMENISSFSILNYHLSNTILHPGAEVVAEYNDGSPLVIVKENVGPELTKRVFLNFFPPSSDIESSSWNSSSNGDLLMANALNWVSSPIEDPTTYCTSMSTRNRFEWIDRVEIGDDIDNTSGRNTSGYGDYTNQILAVENEDNISVTVTPGYKRRAYREYWRIWADWNYDGDFDDAGEKVFEKNGKNIQSGSFTVPTNTNANDLRIRISMRWKKYAPSCGNFSGGEVEDYTIHINENEIEILPDIDLLDGLDLEGLEELEIPDPILSFPRLGQEYSTDEDSYSEIGELFSNPIQSGTFITGIVRVNKIGNHIFTLRNTLGQLVKSVSVNCLNEESEFELPTSNLQSGIYFLTVDTDPEATKIVIQ